MSVKDNRERLVALSKGGKNGAEQSRFGSPRQAAFIDVVVDHAPPKYFRVPTEVGNSNWGGWDELRDFKFSCDVLRGVLEHDLWIIIWLIMVAHGWQQTVGSPSLSTWLATNSCCSYQQTRCSRAQLPTCNVPSKSCSQSPARKSSCCFTQSAYSRALKRSTEVPQRQDLETYILIYFDDNSFKIIRVVPTLAFDMLCDHYINKSETNKKGLGIKTHWNC